MEVPMSMRKLAFLLLLPLLAVTAGCVVAYQEPVTRPAPRPAPPPPPPAPVGLDVSYFYQALDPYGDWAWVRPYGWVWIPGRVAPGWRPYYEGRWAWTEYGWMWVSNESWGWAVYHYGRWAWVNRLGWVWVPGTDWAPAWVAWRYGGGWVGWAPLPPGAAWRAGVGVQMAGVQIDVNWWCFVEEVRLAEPRVHRYAVPAGRNVTLYRQTQDVTRYEARSGRVVNRSVAVEPIERATRRAVPVHRVQDVTSPGLSVDERAGAQEIRVYRPEVRESPRDAAPPRALPRRYDETGQPLEVAPPETPPPARTAPAPAPTPERTQPRTGTPALPPSTPPAAAPSARYDQERRALDQRHAEERRKLEQHHSTEARRPPPGVSPKELATRQAQERKSLEQKIERERVAQEAKHKREADPEQAPRRAVPRDGPR
jgi:hypothetical protein